MAVTINVRPQRGLSAFEIAQRNGFGGTEADWLALQAQRVFVQPAEPDAAGPFLWVQTDIEGDGFTFWFEDGE